VVAGAILAASPHNTQPWQFRIAPGVVELFADEARWLGAMDSLHRELFLGLGCALENAVLTANAIGRPPAVTLFPDSADPSLVARLALGTAEPAPTPLFDVIAERRVNRGEYKPAAVPAELVEALPALADDPRVTLRVVTDAAEVKRFRDEALESVQALTADSEMAQASHHWWRQTPEEVAVNGDGLNLDLQALDPFTRLFAGLMKTLSLKTANEGWVSSTKGRQATGAGLLVLSTQDRSDRAQQLLAGRLHQRAHLTLTTHGVACQPMNMLPELQDREETTGAAERPFTAKSQAWVAEGHGLQMLVRFGYALTALPHSPRRPVEDVMRAAT
jgi:hypothetical protein